MKCLYQYKGNNYTKEEIIELLQNPDNNKVEILPYLNYTVNDVVAMRELFNVFPDETLDFFVRRNFDTQKVFDVNPTLKFVFNEYKNNHYDPSTNTISISLSEVYQRANEQGKTYEEMLTYFIEHELGHSTTTPGLSYGDNADKFLNIYQKVVDMFYKKPFTDTFRGGWVDEDGLPYALKDMFELSTDAFNNPDVKKWLQSISNGKNSLWDRIIDFFRNIIGLGPKTTMYDEIDAFLNDQQFQDATYLATAEGSDSISVFEPQYAANYVTNTLNVLTGRDTGVIDENIQKAFDNISGAITKLRKTLTEGKIQQEQARNIQTLIQKFYNSANNKEKIASGMKMIDAAFNITRDIEFNIRKLATEPDENKLKLLQLYTQQANSLDFLIPLLGDIQSYLSNPINKTDDTDKFVREITSIIDIKRKVNVEYNKLAKPLLIRIMAAELGELPEAKVIMDKANEFKRLAGIATNVLEKKRYEDREAELLAQLDKVPMTATLEKAMAGNLEDASSTDLTFASIAFNKHPIIQALNSMLKRKNIALTRRTLDKKNAMATEINVLREAVGKKGTRNIEEINNNYVEEVDIIENVIGEDPTTGELQFKITKTRMLSSEYDNKYLTKHTELKKTLEFYYDKRNDATTDEDKLKYGELFDKAKNNLKDFIKEHSTRQYIDKYYVPLNILQERIPTGEKDDTGADVTTSLYDQKAKVFETIRDLESEKQKTFIGEDRQKIDAELELAYIELQEIVDPFDKNGVEKIGVDKLLSEQAQKYKDAKKEIGKYTFTDEDKLSYERDVEVIENKYLSSIKSVEDTKVLIDKKFADGELPQKQYDIDKANNEALRKSIEQTRKRSLDNIQVTKLSDEYYAVVDDLYKTIEESVEQMLLIPELKGAFETVDKTIIKDGYAQIRQMTKAYRDNKGVINGIAFQRNKPEAVKVIKSIQEKIAKLSEATDSLKGLSKLDAARLKTLSSQTGVKVLTEEENNERLALITKKAEIAKKYAKNKVAIDDYFLAIKELSGLSETEQSAYYYTEYDNQLNALALEAEKEISENFVQYIKDQKIESINGFYGYYKLAEKEDGTQVTTFVNITDNKILLVSQLAREKAKRDIFQSEWFKNNHYTTFLYNTESFQLEETDVPIYIWNKQTPKDERFVLEAEPSEKYQIFIPDKGMENKDFKLVQDGLGVPKKGSKYASNPKYEELKNSKTAEGKAYYRFLEFARKTKYQTETDSGMQDAQKTFDILPSMSKTENENKINFTNNVFSGEGWKNIKNATFKASENEDVQFAQSGSLKKSNIVPYRYNHILDVSEQSMDVMSMILAYDNANINAMNMKELEDIFEATQSVTSTLPVLKTKQVEGAFSMKKLLNVIRNKSNESGKSVTETVYENTVLHNTVTHMLDTFVRGETTSSALINTFAGTIDAHKVVGTIKQIASRAIFAFKLFSPLKNTIAGKLNALVNSNIGEKFATMQNYYNGTVRASKYIPDLLSDYGKVGNKSFIGQALDYFQVLHGGVQSGLGKYVQWSVLTELGDYVTVVKNLSELELQTASFLGISEANKVTLSNGTVVDFIDAFEIKDGVFQPKATANISENDIKNFIGKIQIVNRFINGAFTADEKSKIEKHPLGSMFYYLNGYVIPGIKNRYGSEFYSVEAEMIHKGYYKEGFKFAKDYFKYGRDLNRVWSTLDNVEKGRVMRFTKEVSTAMFLGSLALFMGSGDNKEELQENSSGYNYLLALTMATASEVQTFIPVPGLGFDEIVRKIKTPFAAVSQVINMAKLINDLLAYSNPFDSEAGRYKTSGIKDGLHDKGDAKFIADFAKFTGWSFAEFSPIDKVMTIKQMQTIRP